MRVDGIAAAAGDIGHDRLKAAVRHLDLFAATPAHDVVVMLFGLTGHVSVVAVGEIEAFERSELGEKVQVPEERGPAQAEAPATRIDEEIGRREVAAPRADEVGHGTPRLSEPITGVGDCLHDPLHTE